MVPTARHSAISPNKTDRRENIPGGLCKTIKTTIEPPRLTLRRWGFLRFWETGQGDDQEGMETFYVP